MKDRLGKIVRLNRWLADARESKNIKRYEELALKLHKMEIEDGARINSYIMRR